MEHFMDRLAQKFTAGEMTRSNSAGEARDLKRLRQQTEVYESCLAEMQKLHLKNTQTAEELRRLIGEMRQNLQSVTKESLNRLSQAAQAKEEVSEKEGEDLYGRLEELQRQIDENQKKNEELFRRADDYLHKENVKVYRNVQAVVVDQLSMKTDAITDSQKKIASRYGKAAITLLVLTLLTSVGHLALWLLQLYGVLGL
ncbi:MAG: hypothetical protein IJC59_02875 [Lachnospiraceae bacterium]|nr:hypothetical protein [Lachnospiraceae bacterium]